MSQVINTNVLSLTAQRNLQTSQSELATSLQRLSSGLRINSAKDDAAGLAISERFTTQIRGLTQAIRNSNDGISLAQTGEAALDTVTENLQRVRELAVQSVNATNSNADRATLDQEVQQRLAEIDRIANQTSFNGRNVLDGSFGDALFQVGANVGQTISVELNTGTRTDDIGAIASVDSADGLLNSFNIGDFTGNDLATGETGQLTLNVGGVVIEADFAAAANAAAQVTAVETAIDGALGSLENAGFVLTDASGDVVTEVGGAGTALADLNIASGTGAEFTITQSITGVTDDGNPIDGFDLSGLSSGGVVEATEVELADNALQIQIGSNADNTVSVEAGSYSAQGLVDAVNTALAGNGSAVLNSDGTFSINAEDTIEISYDSSGTTITGAGATLTQELFDSATITEGTDGNLSTVNVENVDDANETILRVDAALTAVSDLRSTFGAIQNRFESTIENLTTTNENLQASRSRILDADFAAETANLTRVQILQQAGISVLSQANVQPQNVLALLQ